VKNKNCSLFCLVFSIRISARRDARHSANVATGRPIWRRTFRTSPTVSARLGQSVGDCISSRQPFFIANISSDLSPHHDTTGFSVAPAVSQSRMPPGRIRPSTPELLPIRIHPLAAHRLSSLSFWSPRKGQCSPGARTLEAIFPRRQHWYAMTLERRRLQRCGDPKLFVTATGAGRSRISKVDSSRLPSRI